MDCLILIPGSVWLLGKRLENERRLKIDFFSLMQ